MRFEKNAFMPFVVLGDPDYETSLKIVKGLIENGATALELGFPFSDPIADGLVIQRANKRSLDNGMRTKKCFDIIKEIRSDSKIPISVMLSFNIVFNYGTEEFYKKCKELCVDAILCPDVPLEESEELVKYSKEYNVSQVFLVSPTTTVERMKMINKVCSGYIYLVSLLGTTGARKEINVELPDLIKLVKENMNLPVYVGFGISSREHVINVIKLGADGAICGSAICRLIEDNLADKDKIVDIVNKFCKELSGI